MSFSFKEMSSNLIAAYGIRDNSQLNEVVSGQYVFSNLMVLEYQRKACGNCAVVRVLCQKFI